MHDEEVKFMADFIDRQEEINALNSLLGEDEGQFAIVFGRRRVGKTTLLKYWVNQARLPTIYWIARRESPEAVRYSMARAFWRGMGRRDAPHFDNWETQFEEMALLIGDQPLILIFDEFPYAVESDPSLPSHLQAVWDHLFQEKPVILVLAGSHIGMMVDLLGYQAPL
jgi:AAA+ ATPase superfamily predicted ATPase